MNKNMVIFALFTFGLLINSFAFGQGSKVEVVETDGQWSLLVNGEDFYVRGAGGIEDMDLIKSIGGNTVRTWGIDNAQEVLDEAHEKGLKVMLGFWIQHERHGFDYNDEGKVKNQLESVRRAVQKYKDHPALLMWGIGNEYELQYSNTKVWKAVNDIAEMVQKEDANHPISTVTAGTNDEKLKFVMKTLTAIDIYGINTYADIGSVKDVLKRGDFKGPYMITEWGPTGHWESPKTKWATSIEQTSTEKAASYLSRYKTSISSQGKQCIGSFAFLWGQKQEYTSTWYGLFTDDGKPTEAIDELQYCWTGNYPADRAPRLDSILFDNSPKIKNLVFAPGKKCEFEIFATDREGDKLTYKWELYEESTDKKSGGDAEDKPPLIYGKIKGSSKSRITLKAPLTEGRYRLFIFVNDEKKVAYMNVPFYVENDPSVAANKVRFKSQTLKSFNE
ncbi:MAG: hypothetical protein ACI8ZM_004428 [Crocinitomix sp.]|jgi:hypothetical protein